MKLGTILIAFFLLTPLVAAALAPDNKDKTAFINERLGMLAATVQQFIPPVMVGLFTFSGLVYAVSQVFDRDTKMKGERWSMSIATGAGIGLIIVLAAPFLANLLSGMGG